VSPLDVFQYLDQVGARSAAGVQDEHLRIRQAIGKPQFFFEDPVDTRNLIFHDLARGIPYSQVLP